MPIPIDAVMAHLRTYIVEDSPVIRDNTLVEGLAGLEYNGGCWVLRTVAQRIITAEKDVSNAFYIQLELTGMGRLGASPLSALKQSIPGYTPTNEFHTQ